MSRNIGPTVEILLRRVRQEGRLALDPDFATQIYSRCEQVTNAALRRVLSSTSLSTPKERLLFNYRDSISDAIDIVLVTESNREIFSLSRFEDFAAYDIDWFRATTGTRFECWCQLGRDILILYPGQASASSVTIEYVQLLTYYSDFAASYNTSSELPDEDVDIALNLAELVLLAHFRLLKRVSPRMKDFLTLLAKRGVFIK